MCGPHFCSMKITGAVRKAPAGLAESEGLQSVVHEKSPQFAEDGPKIYAKA